MQTIRVFIDLGGTVSRDYYYTVPMGTHITKEKLVKRLEQTLVERKKQWSKFNDYDDSWLYGDTMCVDWLSESSWGDLSLVGNCKFVSYPNKTGRLEITRCEIEEWDTNHQQ